MGASIFVLTAVLVIVDCHLSYAGYGSSSSGGQSTPKKYKVFSIVAAPFVNAPDEDGNLSGLLVEYLDAFKALGGFDYVLSLSPSGLYGDSYPNGTSDGMINEVVSGECDIAAGALTQTYNRTLVVDFTQVVNINRIRIAVSKRYNASSAKYITLNSTSTQTYLQKNTQNPLTRAIWASIQAGLPNSIVTSYEEGVRRVASEPNTAFVAETPFLTIQVQKNPDVFFTSDNLAYTWFAMAVKIDSPLRQLLDSRLLAPRERPRGCHQHRCPPRRMQFLTRYCSFG